MEIYFAALADLELAEIRAAATVHVQTSKWFPKPAEIREAIEGSADDRADLAWGEVVRLVRQYGYWNAPALDAWPDDATRAAAFALYGGGWRNLCEKLPGEGPEFLGAAKLFKASYRAQYRLAQRHELPPSREEAHAVLSGLKDELAKRGLPDHGAL
jgi:hypothetical protein